MLEWSSYIVLQVAVSVHDGTLIYMKQFKGEYSFVQPSCTNPQMVL